MKFLFIKLSTCTNFLLKPYLFFRKGLMIYNAIVGFVFVLLLSQIMLVSSKLTESAHLVLKYQADRWQKFVLEHDCDHRLRQHSQIVNICPTN